MKHRSQRWVLGHVVQVHDLEVVHLVTEHGLSVHQPNGLTGVPVMVVVAKAGLLPAPNPWCDPGKLPLG